MNLESDGANLLERQDDKSELLATLNEIHGTMDALIEMYYKLLDTEPPARLDLPRWARRTESSIRAADKARSRNMKSITRLTAVIEESGG